MMGTASYHGGATEGKILTVSENGFGKRSETRSSRSNRGGKGVIDDDLERNGSLGC